MKMLLLHILVCGLVLTSAAAKKPNVILIITDDQSWDSIGFMGGDVHAPRLNKMAKEGMYFSDFNVTSTVCSPSRNGHFGHHASRHNPHYFEADQLYSLKNDPEENDNVFESNPEVALQMKKELSKALMQFENRPFGEFTK